MVIIQIILIFAFTNHSQRQMPTHPLGASVARLLFDLQKTNRDTMVDSHVASLLAMTIYLMREAVHLAQVF